MKEYQSLTPTRWDCKYHVVFILEKRRKRIFGVLRRHLGEIFHELAAHKEAQCCGQINPDTLLSPFSNFIGVISPIVV